MDDLDIYSPTPEEDMQARIAALRRQSSYGMLGQLTGDKVLAPFGQNLVSNAQHQEQMLNQARGQQLLRAIQAQREQDSANHYDNADEAAAIRAGRGRPVSTKAGELVDYDPVAHTATTLRAAPPPRPMAAKGAGGAAASSSVDDATLNVLADQMYSTSKTSVSNRTPLFNAVVQRMAQRHPDADLATQGAAYHANVGSLHEAQKQADAMDRNESKAGADLDILENAQKQVGLLDNKLLNKPILSMKGNTSPEVAAYLTARQAAIAQVSKVLSANPGAVTEGVRQEAEHLIDENMTPAQFHSALAVLRQDMARNKAAMHQSVSTIGSRIGGKPQAQVSAGVHSPEEIAAAKKWLANPQNGTPEQRAKVQAIVGGP